MFASDGPLYLCYETQDNQIAIIIFPLISIFKFGAPNDEALNGHPLFNQGLEFYSVHEVKNSSWVQDLEVQNSIHPQHNRDNFMKGKKHYIFTFHDSTFECIAYENERWKPTIQTYASIEEANQAWNKLVCLKKQ